MALDLSALRRIIADENRLLTGADIPAEYQSDVLGRVHGGAEALAFPLSTEEVSAPLRYAHEHRVSVTPRGAGTNLVGSTVPLEGGIILDFRIAWAMNINTPGDTIILGTKAGLRIPSTDCWNGTVGGEMTLYHDVAGVPTEEKIPILKNPDDKGLFYHKVRSFLDAVLNDLPAPVPTSEILYNQAIIDGICKSADLGREIEIEIPEI